jgi:class 3 adenylate cyclase
MGTRVVKKIVDKYGPAFIRWVEVGTHGFDMHTRRRLTVINVLMTVIPLLTVPYIITLAILDLTGFAVPILFLLFASPLFLLTPFMWRISVWLGAFYNLIYWIVFETILSYLLGRESGIHFLFLAGATMAILIFGVRVNRMSIISMVAGLIGFMYANQAFTTQSPLVTASPEHVGHLLYLSVFIFFSVNFALIFSAFLQVHRAEALLEKEYAYSEGLLTAMMPKAIADQLKLDKHKTIADGYESVTILFADLVGFTAKSSKRSPEEVIAFLNKLFTRFDQLALEHGVEKIKTLGDSYMAAAGLPALQPDHAQRIAHFSIDMIEAARVFSETMNEDFNLRIGFHTGPAVAGVIGTEKPFYDVWGDTVNTASRLESQGKTDCIQVTKVTKELLEDRFTFRIRGDVEMKGKGIQEVWYLTGRRAVRVRK